MGTSLVVTLVGTKDVGRAYADVDAMASRDDGRALVELAIALEETGPGAGVECWVLEAVFDRIVASLALHPSRDNASSVLEVLAIERVHATQRPRDPLKDARRLGSLLAQGQLPATCDVLAATVSTPLSIEVVACWIQELVVRGVSVSSSSIVTFWNELAAAGHALAPLPLLRLPIEEALPDVLWKDHINGASRSSPSSVGGAGGSKPSLVAAFHLERLATPADLGAAAENWLEESNGQSEGGVFRLDDRVSEIRRGHLGRLPLRCFADASSILTERITPSVAATRLFSVAAAGGAYNRGRCAAYGRRDLWRSMAALSGADMSRPLSELERIARACQWTAFSTDSDWMYNVAWDLGLLCLREDARTFAILAATDTD